MRIKKELKLLEGKHQNERIIMETSKIKIELESIKNEKRKKECKRSTENKEGRAECLSIFF